MLNFHNYWSSFSKLLAHLFCRLQKFVDWIVILRNMVCNLKWKQKKGFMDLYYRNDKHLYAALLLFSFLENCCRLRWSFLICMIVYGQSTWYCLIRTLFRSFSISWLDQFDLSGCSSACCSGSFCSLQKWWFWFSKQGSQ